jgi:hypothetical protein
VSTWATVSDYIFGKRGLLLTAEGNIVEMSRCLNSLDFATDIEIFDSIAEVCNRRMGGIVGTEYFNGFLYSVRSVDIFDCTVVRNIDTRIQEAKHELVMIASGSSSRGSRKVIRAPGLTERRSMSSCETSRVTGIGNRVPSARRRESTTLQRVLNTETKGYHQIRKHTFCNLVHSGNLLTG